MTDEAITRVGAALQVAWNSAFDAGLPDLPPIDLTPEERDYLARAVIEAMENP